MPRYWGALSNSAQLTGNLEAWFIDRDGARVGQSLTKAVQSYSPLGPQLNWKFKSLSDVGDDDAVQKSVLEERVWVAVIGECHLLCSAASLVARVSEARSPNGVSSGPAQTSQR